MLCGVFNQMTITNDQKKSMYKAIKTTQACAACVARRSTYNMSVVPACVIASDCEDCRALLLDAILQVLDGQESS